MKGLNKSPSCTLTISHPAIDEDTFADAYSERFLARLVNLPARTPPNGGRERYDQAGEMTKVKTNYNPLFSNAVRGRGIFSILERWVINLKKETDETAVEIIAIDHGNSQVKTVSAIFTSGVRELATEPAFYDSVLEWRGKFFKIGTKRLEVQRNKTENQDYYFLTLRPPRWS